jgi:dTDP-4-dehydrorhamnose reductase
MSAFSVQRHGKRNGRMKILVTGASGLLGSRLVELALTRGHQVCSAYYVHPPTRGNPRQLDLREEKEVRSCLTQERPEVVIHSAAITDVDLCERNPQLAMDVNGSATGSLAEACCDAGSHLIYVSTDYVFDGKRGSYNEKDEAQPINAYGQSKLLGERRVLNANADFCVVRTSVLYGWGREHRPNFATWLHDNLKASRKVSVVTDQYASPTLNTNLARMLVEVAERRIHGILHLAGCTRISRYDFAVMLAKQFDFNQDLLTPVKADATQWIARRPYDSSLSVGKAKEMLSNKPATLEEALNEFAVEAHNFSELSSSKSPEAGSMIR